MPFLHQLRLAQKFIALGLMALLLTGVPTALYTALIAELLALSDGLLDDYALSLDPNADSYPLIIAAFGHAPALAERLGQLRAQGTGILATGSLSPENRATLIALKSRANEIYGDMIGNLGKSTHLNSALKANLGDRAEGLNAQIAKTLAMAEKELIQATELTLPSETYFQTFNAVALPELSRLLESRATDLRRTQWLMMAGRTEEQASSLQATAAASLKAQAQQLVQAVAVFRLAA